MLSAALFCLFFFTPRQVIKPHELWHVTIKLRHNERTRSLYHIWIGKCLHGTIRRCLCLRRNQANNISFVTWKSGIDGKCSQLKTPCSMDSVKQRPPITLSPLLFVYDTSTICLPMIYWCSDTLHSTFNVTPCDERWNIMAAWLEQGECGFLLLSTVSTVSCSVLSVSPVQDSKLDTVSVLAITESSLDTVE